METCVDITSESSFAGSDQEFRTVYPIVYDFFPSEPASDLPADVPNKSMEPAVLGQWMGCNEP
jgi:hypothetical protein